ncbi:MAG: semialdehyde dehydrogenase [Bauldia sp.]|uniref:phosphogluconate dehydrogenase C-terminal domain-containing protein n=1 Tax=Bauldia sp. TaxID=2575872 RepID=UPI001DEBD3A4|nr:phosphogluconate dehydrogenase C-terminal domain-containing protein [Bauldia sp.]MCB1486948.1 semialdehyde dehydrogenase [Bauldia sp.]MCB1495501.1 semialdehyde dehydrogenase [Bauldia sp.]
MTQTIALLGAGGKMGVRLATNLEGEPYDVLHVEVSEAGRQRLKEATGVECVEMGQALGSADVVLMAVPDALIGKIAHGFIDQVRPGTGIIMLDAAAPHAGELPKRDDVTYFVTHPCHPSIFRYEPTREAQKDYFGGVLAMQAIVCALMQGPDADYARCEAIAKAIYKPVSRSHRVTVEDMAILEPAMSETIAATLITALREATDAVVARGVPAEAARDFMLGHIGIEMGIIFEDFPGRFSDGALYAIEKAKPKLLRDDWLKVLEPDEVMASVREICNPGGKAS